jgi:hypothetical protein
MIVSGVGVAQAASITPPIKAIKRINEKVFVFFI